MYRRIPVLIVALTLVLVVRSDETLKCYMCTSLTDPGCDTDPGAHNIKPEECKLSNMAEWQRTVQQNRNLSAISHIFAVDTSQNYQATAPMACAKMVLKGYNKMELTVRNCQTAKTETIDPCKAMHGKFSNEYTLDVCELCMHDGCNDSIRISPKILLILLSALGTIVLASCNA